MLNYIFEKKMHNCLGNCTIALPELHNYNYNNIYTTAFVIEFQSLLKLNYFPNFERPYKIVLGTIFFGRLKVIFLFFYHILLLYNHKTTNC
jgi:hypothetical protein